VLVVAVAIVFMAATSTLFRVDINESEGTAATLTPQMYLSFISRQSFRLRRLPPPSTAPPPTSTLPITGTLVIHYEPEYIYTIDDRVSSNYSWPTDSTIIHTGELGDVSAQPIPWPVGDFTGFYPVGDLTDFQRGISENTYGSSAVQLQGYTAGKHIHSYSAPSGGVYQLAQILYTWEQSPFPWKYGDGASLCISYETAVPNSWTGGGSINYAYAAISIRDTLSGRRLWIAMDHYDSRGDSAFHELPVWWQEANAAIALGYFGGQRYSSLLPNSNRSSGQTWNDWRYFGFCISREKLQGILDEINGRFNFDFSTNPDNYALLLFGIGPEMSVAGGKQGHMSMKVKDVWGFTWIND
jgi:hypothetical protein